MSAFYQTMKQFNLADKPVWTISTVDKLPIDAKRALSLKFDHKKCIPQFANQKKDYAKNYWGNLASDPKTSLVTLTDLVNEPNAPHANYALHADINTQHVVLIDVEKEYDKSYTQYLKNLPIIYGEKSKHGGMHFLVPISDKIINNPKYKDLLEDSNKKIAQLNDQKHTGIELFFHNHYLTFTENQLPIQNHNTEQGLLNLLDKLLDIVTISTNIKKDVIISNDDYREPSTAVIDIAKHAVTPHQDDLIRRYIFKNEDDPDLSHRDYLSVLYIARTVLKNASYGYSLNPFSKIDESRCGVNIEKDPYDPTMQAKVIIYLARSKYMKHQYRDKWDHQFYKAEQQTYFGRIVNRAIDYIHSND